MHSLPPVVQCALAGTAEGSTAPAAGTDALAALMQLEAARVRAATANAAAVAAEKAKDAAEEEVARLQHALEPKRQRTAAMEEEDDNGPAVGVGEWDLATHRREMTRMLRRRAVQIGSRTAQTMQALRTGEHGYLHHQSAVSPDSMTVERARRECRYVLVRTLYRLWITLARGARLCEMRGAHVCGGNIYTTHIRPLRPRRTHLYARATLAAVRAPHTCGAGGNVYVLVPHTVRTLLDSVVWR